MEYKTCSRCNIQKPTDDFSLRSGRKCGLQSRCKSCYSELNKTSKRRVPPIINLTEPQKAYLAGMIDGEGHIGIYMRRKNKTQNLNLVMFMTISNTSDELYNLFAETGVGAIAKRKPRKENYKPLNVWTISPNACRTLLPLVLPYLRIRKQQAVLAIEYLSLAAHKRVQDAAYSEKVLEIYSAIRSLNHRGVSVNL